MTETLDTKEAFRPSSPHWGSMVVPCAKIVKGEGMNPIKDEWVSDCGSVRLLLGDALAILPTLEAGSVDAVVTDPPWPNVSEHVAIAGRERAWELFSDVCNALPPLKRMAVQIGCDSDPRFLTPVPLPFFRLCWLDVSRPNYKGRLLDGATPAYYFGDPPPVKPGQFVIPGMFRDSSSNGKEADHPCPRKLAHVAWIVKWWTADEDVVLDPFLGSGTTGVACIRTNRRFIGIELERKYWEIAVRRCQAELNRTPLFDQPRKRQGELI